MRYTCLLLLRASHDIIRKSMGHRNNREAIEELVALERSMMVGNAKQTNKQDVICFTLKQLGFPPSSCSHLHHTHTDTHSLSLHTHTHALILAT